MSPSHGGKAERKSKEGEGDEPIPQRGIPSVIGALIIHSQEWRVHNLNKL
jgi:hypothetical protein